MTFLFFVLGVVLLWVGVGSAVFWWGTRTPAPGESSLVRTCERKVAFVQSQVQVNLWASARELPPEQKRPQPCRIVLALDHSGSMGRGPGSPLRHARQAAVSFIRNVGSEHCRIGVVQFDHEGHTVHAVDARVDSLVAAVEGIAPGGGTDIALGLGQAALVLREEAEEPTGTERLVVLLSDGASDDRPAVEQAEKLKADGVRLVTVGLGRRVNKELLEALASGPDDVLHTEDPRALVRLYERIGASIDTARGFRCELEETVSAPEDFLLSSTGDYLPVATRLRAGSIRWYLPTLGATPKRIPYRVLPLRAGWHRIARRGARLRMSDAEGRSHERQSRDSPYLLVLPKLGWPLSFLLLNPLWWILFGALRRREHVVLPELPAPPPPVPLPAPAPVLARPLRERRAAMPPTLLLGVGYSGAQVLRAVRFHLERSSPPAAGKVEYLWIDTDTGAAAAENESVFGKPLDEADRVLLPSNLLPLFRRLESAAPPPPHFAWLDAQHESEGWTPRDYDLSKGTHNRRVLGRAALYAHLEDPTPRLTAEIDRRLEALGPNLRILAAGNMAGGMGGGTLLDLLVLLRKRMKATDVPASVVDVLLLSHRAFDPARWQDVHMRNCRAFATELSRYVVRRHLPVRMPQGPGEEPVVPVSGIVDRVLLLERALENPRQDPRPAAVAHSAAFVVLQQLLQPGAGVDQYLLDDQRRILDAERKSGHAMAVGIGATARWLPIREIRELLTAKTLQAFVSRDLLLLEPVDGRLAARLDGGALEDDARNQLGNLLGDAGLSCPAPAQLGSLEALAGRGSAEIELGKRIGDLEIYPGAPELLRDGANDQLVAEVLDVQARLLDAQLEEWALQVINGRVDDAGNFDPQTRRAGFLRLILAVRRLDELSTAAVENLEAAAQAGPRNSGRHELLLHLFRRYRQSISGFHQHLLRWLRVLAPIAGEARRDETTITEQAAADLSRARSALDTLRRELSPFVVWSEAIEEKLTSDYVDTTRRQLLEQTVWITAQDGTPPRLRLRVQAVDDVAVGETRDAAGRLYGQLGKAAAELHIGELATESLESYVDLGSWLESETRPAPIDLEAQRHAALTAEPQVRREFAVAPAESPAAAAAHPAAELRITAGEDPDRAFIVGVLTPCALFATAAVGDYERRLDEEPHSRLPFLDPVDRLAAEHEDEFERHSMTRPFLSPALRAYFVDRAALRCFVLAAVLGLVRRAPGTSEDILRLGDLPLTEEPRQVGYPLLLEALDRFVVDKRVPGAEQALDLAAIEAKIESLLKDGSESTYKETSLQIPQTIAPLTDDGPPALHEDFAQLGRLLLAVERTRRRDPGGPR